MKSKIAKAKIESMGWYPYDRYGEIDDAEEVYYKEDVIDIIELAEQDAEERLLEELRVFLKESDGDPITEATFVDFKRYINKGGRAMSNGCKFCKLDKGNFSYICDPHNEDIILFSIYLTNSGAYYLNGNCEDDLSTRIGFCPFCGATLTPAPRIRANRV